jgi:hypothetical protein
MATGDASRAWDMRDIRKGGWDQKEKVRGVRLRNSLVLAV